MVIQKLDDYFFKLTLGDLTIGINPISKESKRQTTRFGADIVLVQARHPDFNGIEMMESKGKTTFTAKGPGEYETQDIFIKGFRADTKYDKSIQHCTVYSVLIEGVNVVFCGPLFDATLSEEATEELYQADLLFVPVDGGNVMDAPEAAKFAKKFSPKFVVPMTGDKKAAEAFFNAMGQEPIFEEKLTLKKKDFDVETIKAVALNKHKK